jgi:outer membrane usher protein
MVNGIKQLSASVPPGPFAISSLPVVSGAGDVSVTLLDALGQPTSITLPFYASSALLTPGLVSYSVEFGMVREDYGLRSDHYSGWGFNQSSRFGLTDWLTLESHAEAARGLAMAGGGAAILLGTLGIANVAAAGSTGDGASGAMVSAGFQRVSRRLNFGVSGTYATGGFRDIASLHGSPLPKMTLDANFGYQLGRWGSLGLAYNRRSSRTEQAAAPRLEDSEVELITGSYNVSVAGFANLHATGFKDLRDKHAFGLGAGLSFPLGRGGHASMDVSLDRGGVSRSVNMVRSAQAAGDFGYRVRASDGDAPQRSAEGEYVASWGRLTAGVEQFSGRFAARAGARGAVALAGGDLYASDRIDDSFAVVSTGDVGGVPVMYENRPIGRSNKHGKLLIPSLRSFQDNRLSLDSTLLPADVEVGETEKIVRPADRSGVLVDFGVRRAHAALVSLVDGLGKALPLGSVASVEGEEDQPVGHDGAAYMTGLKPRNRLSVALPDGSNCTVQFDYRPVSGDIPLIGPLRCL